MKKTFLIIAACAFLGGTALLNSCKKDDSGSTDYATLNEEQSSDAEDINASNDYIDDEIDNVMSASSVKSTSAVVLPCNVTIDSSLIANKKMTITFNGNNCAGTRTRTGKVTVELISGSKWQDAGAVLKVTYQDLKIVRNQTGKYVILNGVKTHTNVSGGLVRNLGLTGTPATIVRKIESSNMNITFTNGTSRTWNIARQRTFTKSGDYLVITVSGFGEANGHTNLVEWGTNRRGTEFYTEISTPIVYSQACDYRPSSGVKTHYVGTRQVKVTLGTDSTGAPVSSGCADYYKIEWTSLTGTKTAILPY